MRHRPNRSSSRRADHGRKHANGEPSPDAAADTALQHGPPAASAPQRPTHPAKPHPWLLSFAVLLVVVWIGCLAAMALL